MPTQLPTPRWDVTTGDWVLRYSPPLSVDVPTIARAMAISHGFPPEVFGKQGSNVGQIHIRPAVAHLAQIRVGGHTEPIPDEAAVAAWVDTLRRQWIQQ